MNPVLVVTFTFESMLTKISLCFLIFISPFMRNISFTMLIILCFVNVVNSKLLFTVSSLIFSQ